jgi:FkbM family methyltransferase
MIIFKEFIDNKKGIQFESLEPLNIIIKIIDGYTGLCSYQEKMYVEPNIIYYFFHPVEVYHRRFEIWDNTLKTMYLKIDSVLGESVNIKSLDKYNVLKDYKYNNPQDKDPALSLYEIFVTKIYDKFFEVNEGDVVVDIGGNLGLFSYYSICKGAKHVYCFEPSPQCYNCIIENFNISNLTVEEAAVGAKDGEVIFNIDPESSINSSMFNSNKNSQTITCKSININNYIKINNINKIDYLKIDCEGAEYEIIESLDEQYLTNNIDKICLEYHFNKDGKINTILDKLKKCNFVVNFEYGDYQINDELGIIYAYKQNKI